MKRDRSIGVLDINSPVILGMTLVSFVLWALGALTGGASSLFLAVRYTSWGDPLMYLRMFTHVLVHADFAHFLGNYLLMLVVGPIVEEKYGSRTLLAMLAMTAFITGLLNVIFFRGVALLGASGLVFMLILLSSFTNLKQGKIPLTVVLVAVLYIGNEVVNGIFASDNISQVSHIIGGVCGAGFGFALPRRRPKAG